ncbi:MAG: serine/threonine protein kinase [Pseudomonadales bacterium]|nr:serine/threonine protein kinase [Pseudomonadales bacterium]
MSDSVPENIPGFQIHNLIAKGGMARVYLATQTALQRKVALKIMDGRKDENFAERFLNEGRLVASLNHPNVIKIHDLGRLDDGRVFISMEYIDGEDLEQRLARPIGADKAVAIIHKIAECLAHVHEHGVIHRDIKPANILFNKEGTLVLTDFGIAKQKDTDVSLTRDGDMVGSPGYMSPEQARAKEIDHRSDLYSLGVIFAEMLTGNNQFKDDSYIQTSMNHIQMELPHLDDNLSQYQSILDRLLDKNPNQRFTNAKALIHALDQLEGGDDDTGFDLSKIKMPRKSLLARFDTLIFIVLLIGFLGAGGYLFQQAMVKNNLEKAAIAYSNDRLMLPPEKNAVYFYRQVQRFDPGNTEAQVGLDQVAERYVSLAEKSLKRRQKKKAKKYLQRGLTASPNNEKLLALQAKLKK